MNNLKRNIGFLPAFSTVIGIVIGSGVFFKASIIYKTTGNVSLGMIAWVLGGIITICAGLTVAELAAAIPETGGMIVWIERAYGRPFAYLLGWAQTVIYFPASMAAAAIIFATQCVNLFQLDKIYNIPIAIAVALSVTCLNLLGGKTGGIVQTIATICKLIPIFAIVIFGLFQANPHTVELFPNSSTFSNDNSFTALGSALLATMYAYDGWIAVGNIAGEMVDIMKDKFNCKVENIETIIGPSVSVDNYEVSYDLIEKFSALEVPNYYKENAGKYYLDLWQLNKELLKKCGILEDNIKIIDFCTVRDNDKFFSYRLDNATPKRIGTMIQID